MTGEKSGIYRGVATAADSSFSTNHKVTISGTSAALDTCDYVVWGGETTSSYTKGGAYTCVRNHNALFALVQDTTAEACATVFGDVMSMVDADESAPAMLMAKAIAANTAFIGSLFANQIMMMQMDGTGGVIKSESANVTYNDDGSIKTFAVKQDSHNYNGAWAIDFFGNSYFQNVNIQGRLKMAIYDSLPSDLSDGEIFLYSVS